MQDKWKQLQATAQLYDFEIEKTDVMIDICDRNHDIEENNINIINNNFDETLQNFCKNADCDDDDYQEFIEKLQAILDHYKDNDFGDEKNIVVFDPQWYKNDWDNLEDRYYDDFEQEVQQFIETRLEKAPIILVDWTDTQENEYKGSTVITDFTKFREIINNNDDWKLVIKNGALTFEGSKNNRQTKLSFYQLTQKGKDYWNSEGATAYEDDSNRIIKQLLTEGYSIALNDNTYA